ncbi:DNA polymerase lambda [Trichonephila clavata]|uniref:DNA polymerase lambda n=1 Tax=Trichonephila clavata TaxID=2740835 RepID=A0A8X6M4H6_TRICU|nr:DNA polymerase lambda [Trichonephila clavata]
MPKHTKDISRVKLKKASERHRAKPIPLKCRTPEEPTNQIFENMCIYIHPINITDSRLKVLHSLINKNRGKVTSEPDDQTTHVLVDDSISSAKLCHALGWEIYPPHMNVLLVGWLSASIGANRCLEIEDYEIPCTHSPTFVREQEHVDAIEGDEDIRNRENEVKHKENCDYPSDLSKESESETASFDSIVADVTSYDDGKYEDETSCDDDWIRVPPLVPVIPLCDQITLPPFTDFKSALQAHTSDSLSNETPNTPPPQQTDTLAARLRRIRIRRIPEHLRMPGESTIYVDLNNENLPEKISDEQITTEAHKQIVKCDTNFITNEMKTNNADDKNKLSESKEPPSKEVPLSAEEEAEETRRGKKRSWRVSAYEDNITTYDNERLNTESILEFSDSKEGKEISLDVFSPNEKFDMNYVNENDQNLKMRVEVEGAISEQVVSGLFEKKSTSEFTKEIHQVENTPEEIVSEILLQITEDVSKVIEEVCAESKITIAKTMNENVMNVSQFDKIDKIEVKRANVETESENMDISEPEVTIKSESFQNESIDNYACIIVDVRSVAKGVKNIFEPEAKNKNESVDGNIINIVHPTSTNKDEIKIANVETMDENKMDISLQETLGNEVKIASMENMNGNKMDISLLGKQNLNEIEIVDVETVDVNKIGNSVLELQNGNEIKIASVAVDKSKNNSLPEKMNDIENVIASTETVDEHKKHISMPKATNGKKNNMDGIKDILIPEATNENENNTMDEIKKDILIPDSTDGTAGENKKDILIPEATNKNENNTMDGIKKDILMPEATNGIVVENKRKISITEAIDVNDNRTVNKGKDISVPEATNGNENKVTSIKTVDENQMDVSLLETIDENEVRTVFVESMSKNLISISQDENALEPSLGERMNIKSKNSAKRLKFDTGNAELYVFQSSQSSIVPIAAPYPMHVYCSLEGESPIPPCLSNDEMNFQVEESKIFETVKPHNENQNSGAISEVTNNKNESLCIDSQCKELENITEPRSCSRPDIRGPNIFFPFPISKPSTSQTSDNSASFNKPSDPKYFLYSDSPNVGIIKKLQLLHDGFKKCKDIWRVHAYDRAISLLGRYPKEIESFEEVASIGNMSKKIALKIWCIKQTGELNEIEEICNKRWPEARKLLTKAWGISPRIAFKLYIEGNVTIQDAFKKSCLLSRIQRIGLGYYRDLRSKMCQEEATTILKTVVKIIFDVGSGIQCDACSSLRRKKKVISNISILVTLIGECQNNHQLLPDIVAKLHRLGYIADDIIRHYENGNQTKYVGIFRFNKSSKYRRLEITVCPEDEHACAIMSLTGTSYFNRAIRQWAARKEMLLDEHSLRIRLLDIGGGTSAVTRLYTPDEASIFRYLQLPYRTPEQRDRIIM